MSELIEVKKMATDDATAANWPASLYARPVRHVAPPMESEPVVPDEILEGCRLAVQQLGAENVTSLGITSTVRGEGRTTIALSMALVLAEYGIETTLVEMDIANPVLGHRLAVAKYPGLIDLAEGRSSLQDVMRPICPGLMLIPAGQLHGTVPRVLTEVAKADVLGDIAAAGRAVVADLPPLLSNSAGHQAANLMAEVVVVVRAGVVPAASITEGVSGLSVTPKVLVNGTYTRVPRWVLRLAGI